jgi:hypothetical protein
VQVLLLENNFDVILNKIIYQVILLTIYSGFMHGPFSINTAIFFIHICVSLCSNINENKRKNISMEHTRVGGGGIET